MLENAGEIRPATDHLAGAGNRFRSQVGGVVVADGDRARRCLAHLPIIRSDRHDGRHEEIGGKMTALHLERMDAVLAAIRACGAATIADLGCGEGPLLLRLAQGPGVQRVLGLDSCLSSLEALRTRLDKLPATARSRVELVHGSMTDGGERLAGFDAAILVETIEHLEPHRLSVLERAVFGGMRPGVVIVSTPNRDFNGLLGVPPHRHRHPDHRFEWDRARFRRWAAGVAARNGYGAACHDIAGCHPTLGGASQMAVFQRHPRLAAGPTTSHRRSW